MWYQRPRLRAFGAVMEVPRPASCNCAGFLMLSSPTRSRKFSSTPISDEIICPEVLQPLAYMRISIVQAGRSFSAGSSTMPSMVMYQRFCRSMPRVVVIWLMKMYCVLDASRTPMPFEVPVIFSGTQ